MDSPPALGRPTNRARLGTRVRRPVLSARRPGPYKVPHLMSVARRSIRFYCQGQAFSPGSSFATYFMTALRTHTALPTRSPASSVTNRTRPGSTREG